jgi:hypothetical protein
MPVPVKHLRLGFCLHKPKCRKKKIKQKSCKPPPPDVQSSFQRGFHRRLINLLYAYVKPRCMKTPEPAKTHAINLYNVPVKNVVLFPIRKKKHCYAHKQRNLLPGSIFRSPDCCECNLFFASEIYQRILALHRKNF